MMFCKVGSPSYANHKNPKNHILAVQQKEKKWKLQQNFNIVKIAARFLSDLLGSLDIISSAHGCKSLTVCCTMCCHVCCKLWYRWMSPRADFVCCIPFGKLYYLETRPYYYSFGTSGTTKIRGLLLPVPEIYIYIYNSLRSAGNCWWHNLNLGL